ncbi:LytTR family DNA-binding domain-containing protein [Aliifodinibius sp. S!AR15-10]|uniref:LytR/AlgR family response regulator transcription factor n=1 Tax=Aliifodinibius sp. S!AR15-10 TaxID=2950437 RepID=UPI00286159A7|nr:LytTR family DNA-binding domain-containing protein [Aliifodinibius sp. S!AR15-10]MDR8389676.1 LytTR family DNA-binding domain-containing protein [Aliifodinibius sp. S!AR15-10]
MQTIKCLILEDEKPAQGVLKKYIGDVPYLELAAVHANPLDAMEMLQSKSVDLIFLDINLPKISGLNFLKSLNDPPEVIITTAYSEYALEGFELNVADYLLKPISFERFLKAVSSLKTGGQQVEEPEEITQENAGTKSFTFEKADNVIYKIDYQEIRYIESDRDYVRLFMDERKLMFRQSLKYWEEILPEHNFARVHKSYILNIAQITRIVGNRVYLGDDVIPIGRSYKDDFIAKIKDCS